MSPATWRSLARESKSSSSLAQDYTTIPVPIPDISVRTTTAQVPISSSASMTASASVVPAPSVASVTHLPPLPITSFSLIQSPSLPPRPAITAVNSASPFQRPVSSTTIALLAIGSACLVLFILILVRTCTRPKRHPRLMPSLPILDKQYLIDDLESKDSPIFGGKERLSPKIDSIQGWVNLNCTSQESILSRPARAAKFGTNFFLNGCDGYGDYSRSPRPQEKTSYSDTNTLSYSRADCNKVSSQNGIYQPPYQQVQNAITQTMKRLSAVSLSLYPSTPRPTGEVGIALSGQETPLTGDGYSVMARSRSKSLKAKECQVKQFFGLAYDTADVDFPNTVECHRVTAAPESLAQGGRTRIKSSYYIPGISLRVSTVPTSVTTSADATKDRAAQKSDARRERDTRSLTRALGLASPSGYEMPSPDDPLSDAENSRTHPSPLISDPGANLGTLLLSESASPPDDTLSVPSLRFEGGKTKSHESRIQDKPPRVPSPPPLPSLAQMAMEHHDREAFENYKSPTYSIYGLYGEERRSFGALYR
ncbi:hypothetical protein APHAL10511_001110 [Amanita phalloides]|nr:hypothetical protein APHAL10511_001110 [Amanita phalloides]